MLRDLSASSPGADRENWEHGRGGGGGGYMVPVRISTTTPSEPCNNNPITQSAPRTNEGDKAGDLSSLFDDSETCWNQLFALKTR